MDFSGFQMQRLLKRRLLQQRLDEVVKEISQKNHVYAGFDPNEVVESRKIVSDTSTHYVLIKKAIEAPKPTEVIEEESSELNIESTMEDVVGMDSDGLSQQELFAILASGSSENPLPPSSTSGSTEESEFEEVPPVKTSGGLVLTIDPNEAYREADDMFADVFATPKSSEAEVAIISSSSSSSSDEQSDIEVQEIVRAGKGSNFEGPCLTHVTELSCTSSEVDQVQPKESKAREETFKNKEPLDVSLPVKEATPMSDQFRVDETRAPQAQQHSPAEAKTEDEESDESDILEEVVDSEVVPDEVEIVNEPESNTDTISAVQANVPKKSVEIPVVLDQEKRQKLEAMQNNIDREQSILIQEHGRQERLASSITDQMYAESQVNCP